MTLGLPADSFKNQQSFFHHPFSNNIAYTKIDIEIIQLLYNYHLPVGMTEQEFGSVFLE